MSAAAGGAAGGPPGAAGLRGWRLALLSLAIPVLFLATGVVTRGSYGETWDEQFDQDIGRFYLDQWGQTGVKGLEERFIPLQRHYGPFFDVLTVSGARLLSERSGLVKDPVDAVHMPVLLASSALLLVVFWLGRALFGGLSAGLLGQAILALMPQFIGHSQNNLKDMPLAAFFCLSAFLYVRAVRSGRAALFVLAGAASGLTYAIKLHALFLVPIVLLWQAPECGRSWRRWGRLLLGLLASGVAAFAAVLAAWPYYRSAPFTRLLETLRVFGSHEYNELVFYCGRHIRAHDVPWHFPFVMLGVNTPLVFLVLFLAGAALLVDRTVRGRADASSLRLLVVWFLFPPLVQVATRAILLDGVRHYLLLLPAMALLGGYAAREAIRWLGSRPRHGPALARAGAAVLALAMADVLAADVRIHPYQVVFFNRLAGGIRGARERFELDYWGTSFRAAADWINRTCPAGSRIWLPLPAEHFLHIDRSRMRFVPGPDRSPHYKVSLIRGMARQYDTEEADYLHPKRKPVWAVTVDGADVLQVFEYPENRDLPDGVTIEPLPPVPGAVPPALEPGLVAREFRSGSFYLAPLPETAVWERLAFDCEANPYGGRPAAVRAEGFLVVEAPGAYLFEVASDDDAVLSLGGRAFVTNPSTATTRKSANLSPGLYPVRLDYRNDVGPACLSVRWTRPGGAPEVLAAPALRHAAP